jgi:hypothetical protein
VDFDKDQFEKFGFAQIVVNEGMMNAAQYSKDCSGSRSDCCTRTCSADENFAGSSEEWDAFLSVKGGQVQY